jgi:excisionase family DNA binding protein
MFFNALKRCKSILQYIGKHDTMIKHLPKGASMQTLDLKEAAAYLKISPYTLRNWCAAKTIPFHKAGRRVVFFREELEAWLLKGGSDAGKGKK